MRSRHSNFFTQERQDELRLLKQRTDPATVWERNPRSKRFKASAADLLPKKTAHLGLMMCLRQRKDGQELAVFIHQSECKN